MSQRERARVEVERPRCPFCREAVGPDDEKAACGACMAWHHRACWGEHGRCAACGGADAAGAAPAAGAPVAPTRSAPARARGTTDLDPFAREQRDMARILVSVGAANVLIFGALLAWSLLGGPDLAALSSLFVALGGWLTWFGLRTGRGVGARGGKGA